MTWILRKWILIKKNIMDFMEIDFKQKTLMDFKEIDFKEMILRKGILRKCNFEANGF